MKIIKDEQRQINLHPLVIYFVLSSKDSKERTEALSKLNKYQGFTRGIFKLQTIEHDGKYREVVSSEIHCGGMQAKHQATGFARYGVFTAWCISGKTNGSSSNAAIIP